MRFLVVILGSSALLILSAGGGRAASLPVCKPEISAVSEPAILSRPLAVQGLCLGKEKGAVLIGSELQPVLDWSDTRVEILVQLNDPSDHVTLITPSGDSATAAIHLVRYNFPDAPIIPGLINVRVNDASRLPALADSAGAQGWTRHFPEFGVDEGPKDSGGEVSEAMEDLARWYQMRIEPGRELEAVKKLAEDWAVDWASPEFVVTTEVVPNDRCLQPPLEPYCGGVAQWAPQKIGAPSAWDVTQGSATIYIAVVDSGVAFGHHDLQPNYGSEADFTGSGLGDGCPISSPGHGSHVAGIASARGGNDLGIAGISWHSRIRSYKVLVDTQNPDTGQWSCRGSSSHIGTAIVQAADAGAKVINLSLSYPQDPFLLSNVTYARSKGSVVVASAGNDGQPFSNYPAAYPNVISVAASTQGDTRASFSNYGTNVDVSAPGVGILSTIPPNAYGTKSGTSMASPHVAGLAALLATKPFYPCEIQDTIKETAVWVGSWSGAGRVDAAAAVNWFNLPSSQIVSATNHPNNAIIRQDGSPTVWIIQGGRKYQVNQQDFATMGLQQRHVQCVPFSVSNAIPEGPGDNQVITSWGSLSFDAAQCGRAFAIPDSSTRFQLLASGYTGPYGVPPGEYARLNLYQPPEGTKWCNLRETTASDEYILCPSGKKWKINHNTNYSPPNYVRQRLFGANQPPFRTLWDGALSGYSVASRLNCHDNDLPFFDGDPVGDGFDTLVESNYLGTAAGSACAATPALNDEPPPDAWPFDFNDDQRVTTQDVLNLPAFGTKAGDSMFNPRADFNADGIITSPDVLAIHAYFGMSCADTPIP